MFRIVSLLIVILFFVSHPLLAQEERNKILIMMDSLCIDIYSLEGNNPELGKLISSKECYAKKFLDMRNLTNYFYNYYGNYDEPFYIKDYIADDGCYMTIYQIGEKMCYMFKHLCSECSSLLYEDPKVLQHEIDVFSEWNLEKMEKLRKEGKDKNGISQIFKGIFKSGDSYKLQMFTYPGFYISGNK